MVQVLSNLLKDYHINPHAATVSCYSIQNHEDKCEDGKKYFFLIQSTTDTV